MKTIKKKVYKLSVQSRMNQSKAAKSRWDAMTPEEQAAQIAKLQAARAAKKKSRQITKQPSLNLDAKQEEVAEQNNPYVFNPSVLLKRDSVVTPRTLELASNLVKQEAEIAKVINRLWDEDTPPKKEANQIDLIAGGLGKGSFIAGYDNMDKLLEFVEASLRGTGNLSMANLIVAMTIATCKNLIDEKLGEQQ